MRQGCVYISGYGMRLSDKRSTQDMLCDAQTSIPRRAPTMGALSRARASDTLFSTNYSVILVPTLTCLL